MKKFRQLISVLLVLLTLLTLFPVIGASATSLPFQIRSTGALIENDEESKTFVLTYDENCQSVTLEFLPYAGWEIKIYADPLCRQEVELSLVNTVKLFPEQKDTYLYVKGTKEEYAENYTVHIKAPRTAVQYRDDDHIADWARPYFDYCNFQGFGIIQGDQTGRAHPNNSLSRYETALIAARVLGTDCSLFPYIELPYEDDIVMWAESGVSAMTQLGIISGNQYGKKLYYNGDDKVTREQVAKILVNISLQAEGNEKTAEEIYTANKASYDKKLTKFTDIDKVSKWAIPYIAVATNYFKFMAGSKEKGGLYLNPTQDITRQEMTTMVARELDYNIDAVLGNLLSRTLPYATGKEKMPKAIKNTLRQAYNNANAVYANGTDKQKEKAYTELYAAAKIVLRPRVVYLSPSNQMTNPYTGVDTNEGAQMQAVAKLLKPKLEAMGFIVYIGDVKTPLIDRATEAERLGADIYVAIHSNATGGKNNGSWQGSLVFHSNNDGSKELAEYVSQHLSALTPTKDSGIVNDGYSERPYKEILHPQMTNVLVEVEFHDYPDYAKWIVNHKSELATAFADAILDYFLNY